MNGKTPRFRRLRGGALIGLVAAALAAPSAEAGKYIAGFTDFPNALRVADARGAGSAVVQPTASPAQSSTSTFSWNDAGIGAGATLGVGLLLLGMGVALRNRTRTVRTH